MRTVWGLAAALASAPLAAEIIPEPSSANPRIQTVRWQGSEAIQLTALPATGLTLMFEPGETITNVEADAALLDTRVAHERSALQLYPLREGLLGALQVATDRRSYRFNVRTGTDLMAAYLVRFESGPPAMSPLPMPPVMPQAYTPPLPMSQSWSYRLRGDRAVQPAQISDDGARTTITFAEGRALPAIFAIGATGEEQVVNGYMRAGRFVIDQIWSELVFRIDDKKATARRAAKPDDARG